MSPRAAAAVIPGLHEVECLLQDSLRISNQVLLRSYGHAGGAEDGVPAGASDAKFWQRVLDIDNNQTGDLSILLLSLVFNILACIVCVVFFIIMRKYNPMVYQNNARRTDKGGLNTAPFTPSSSIFGWLSASWMVTAQQRGQCCGVDQMLLIEFSDMSMRLLALIGIPGVCILCPLHWALGDGMVDRLSQVGMANISKGSPLRWVHCVAVWYVVLATGSVIHRAMERFLSVRYEWLLGLEPPRSTTVLVQGIPEAFRTDHELKAFFEMLFPDGVETANVVKKTDRLRPLTAALKNAKLRLEEALFEWDKADQAEDRRPKFYRGIFSHIFLGFGGQNDRIDYYRDLVLKLEEKALQESDRILQTSKEPMVEIVHPDGTKEKKLSPEAQLVTSDAGFVTFTTAREARLILGMCLTGNQEEFVMRVPPHHDDIIYSDLEVPKTKRMISHAFGYIIVIAIFISFMPIMCTIGSFAASDLMRRGTGALTKMFQGVISSLALTTFTSFLPTILMMVFNTFFVLRAYAWGQLKLQTWLFWFNVIYVVLITSLSGTLIGQMTEIIRNPLTAPMMLARSMPFFSHFYLNYVVMQWAVHGMNLTRYIQLTKYHIWRAFVGPERAIALAEPEDQDYYGIGHRSAAWTILLIIGIVFSTVTPLITLFCFVNFWITRTVYGYLIVFSETRKQDLGGHFFVTQLWHLQYGLIIYVVLMVGIMWEKYRSVPLVFVTGASFVHVIAGIHQFYWRHWRFQWEQLPFPTLCTQEAKEGSILDMRRYRSLGGNRPMYRQPELAPKTRLPSEAMHTLQAFQKRQRLEIKRTGPSSLAKPPSSYTRSALLQKPVQNLPKWSARDAMLGLDFDLLEMPVSMLEAHDMSFPIPIADAREEEGGIPEDDGEDSDTSNDDETSHSFAGSELWSPDNSEASHAGDAPATSRSSP